MTNSERANQWDSFKLRLQDEAGNILANNRQRGLAIVTAHVLMDASGHPLVWVIPKGKRIEPSKNAAGVIQQIIEAL